jgi:hypothetical protein
MSRARHKKEGGGLTSKPVWNAGGEQNAAKEAEELRHGGAARHHGEGHEGKARGDRKRARGGGVTVKEMKHHSMHHAEPHQRARGGRLRGEGTMADKSPMTTAAKIKMVTPGEIGEDAEKSD